jgi:hypothetical protein
MSISRLPSPGAGIPTSTVTAKGDLIAGTANNAVSRLAVGTNGYTLVADSSASTGLAWSAPAGGGGKVLQVVQATTATETVIQSTSYNDSGLSGSITPTSSSSRILVFVTQPFSIGNSPDSGTFILGYQLHRKIGSGSYSLIYNPSPNNNEFIGIWSTVAYLNNVSLSYVDSPATTSQVTYKTMARENTTANNTNITFQRTNTATSTLIMMEIGA